MSPAPADRAVTRLLLVFAAYELTTGVLLWAAPGYFFEHIGPYGGSRNEHYMADNAGWYISLAAAMLVAVRRSSRSRSSRTCSISRATSSTCASRIPPGTAPSTRRCFCSRHSSSCGCSRVLRGRRRRRRRGLAPRLRTPGEIQLSELHP